MYSLQYFMKLVAEKLLVKMEKLELRELTGTGSQTEIEKLKKRLTQIETDLEEKDRTLLEQETQMLALTDRIEANQKVEEGLRQRLVDFQDMEYQNEEKKAQLIEQIRERSDMLE